MIDNYHSPWPGYWRQTAKTGDSPVYDHTYVDGGYSKYPTEAMSRVRYDAIRDVFGSFESVMDVGYGNGAFLQYCNDKGHETYGFDISEYPLPSKTKRAVSLSNTNVDLVTFYDSLEHFDCDLVPVLQSLRTHKLVISVPWLHSAMGPTWFAQWKHRKENEHLHHFDLIGLQTLVTAAGYTVLCHDNNEDVVRTSVTSLPNILTVFAIR